MTSVSIRHGDLVDSVTLRYASGRVVSAGGGGGSTSGRVDIDVEAGERVLGFFGGILLLLSDNITIRIIIILKF